MKNLMLFSVGSQQEFDFDTMIGDNNYATITGIPVKIDRIIRDITKTTVVAISGTMLVRGVKIRGVWDVYGNIIKCKELLSLFTPKSLFVSIDNIFYGITEDMFRLVSVQDINGNQ